MNWVLISVIAYFLSGANSVIDKYLLHRSIPQPLVYAFYVGVFSIFSVIIAPFGLAWPGFEHFLYAIGVGIVFLCALIAFFIALKADEASRIVALVGGATPGFILVLSIFVFGITPTHKELFALAFLVFGTVVISTRRNQKCSLIEFHKHECVQSTEIALLAALLFALFFVSAKFVFNSQEFISGFVWTRIGSFLGALLLLLIPFVRRQIFHTTKNVKAKMGALFVINKTLAGVAFFLLNYAIAIGNIALVNALEGVKYLFILAIMLIITRKLPTVFAEEITPFVLIQKTVAVVSIALGLVVLST
ncbi:MAG: hypothetical protein AAB819_02335 [Patescibacteria group bacterium]